MIGTLRQATLHLLGDREGYISAPFLSAKYGAELVGFDPLNGVYSTGERKAQLDAHPQRRGAEGRTGGAGRPQGTWCGVYNYKTGEILCAVSSPTYDPDDVPDRGE